MIIHRLLIPEAETASVWWLVAGDGRCRGYEYYQATPKCKKALVAQARQMAKHGYVSKMPENGHWLQGEFSKLYELKPGNHRFMTFRDRRRIFITNGAPKRSNRKQRADYQEALQLMAEYLARISGGKPDQ